MLGFLLLGTDTDVGKTYAAGLLCSHLVTRGLTVTACKPVETGDPRETDLAAIARIADAGDRLRCAPGVHLALAAAPPAAARAAGVLPPTCEELARIVRAAEAGSDAVVVESCGGALTPLSDIEYMADLAHALPDYGVLLVAGLKLGALGHAFGAAEYVRSIGRRIDGVVLVDRFAASPSWFVDSTTTDLAARDLKVSAFVPHGAAPADVLWTLFADEISRKG